MAFVTFPEPKDLNLKFEDMVLDGRSKNLNPYGVSNPHPGFGKDPNILNEFGHTKFPMWVDSKIEGKRVIVNNEMELAQHTSEQKTTAPAANPWPTAAK